MKMVTGFENLLFILTLSIVKLQGCGFECSFLCNLISLHTFSNNQLYK